MNIGDLVMQVALQKRREKKAAGAGAQPSNPGTPPPGSASTPLQPPAAPMQVGPPDTGAGFGRSGFQTPGTRPIPGLNDSGGSPVMQSGGGMSDSKRAAIVAALQASVPQAQPIAAPQPPAAAAPPPPQPPMGGAPPVEPAQTQPLPPPPPAAGMQLPPGQPGSSVGGQIADHQGGMQQVGGAQPAMDLGVTPPLSFDENGQMSGQDEIAKYIQQQQIEGLMMDRSRERQDQIVEEMMRRRRGI